MRECIEPVLFTNDVLQQTLNLWLRTGWIMRHGLSNIFERLFGDSRRMSDQEVEIALEKVWAVLTTSWSLSLTGTLRI